MSAAGRFWRWVAIGSPDECWPWRGGTGSGGYGQTRFRGEKRKAHVVAYLLSKGPLRPGEIVRHSCDNPPCCNPRHLHGGTHAQNMAEMVERGRSARGEAHPNAALSDRQVAAVLRSSESSVRLAARLGVSARHIRRIRQTKGRG